MRRTRRGYGNPRLYESYETYSAKITAINELHKQAPDLFQENVLVYCTDEMTGIQALENEALRKGVIPGASEKREFSCRCGMFKTSEFREYAGAAAIAAPALFNC